MRQLVLCLLSMSAMSVTAVAQNPNLKPGVWKNITPPTVRTSFQDHVFCQGVTLDSRQPATVYLCICAYDAKQGGLFKSTDSGTTWKRIGQLDEPLHVAVDPHDSNHLYCVDGVRGETLGFWVSSDGGETWLMPDGFKQATEKPVGTRDLYSLAVDPTDFKHVLVSFHSPWADGKNCGVLESKDGGQSWVAHAPPPSLKGGYGMAVFFLFEPGQKIGDKDTWLFTAQEGGFFKTTDGGKSWKNVYQHSMTHGGNQLYRVKNGTLYSGGYQYPARSVDNGSSWEQIKTGLTYSWYMGICGDGENLYTACSNKNEPFFVSPESDGLNWKPLNSQKFSAVPFEMAFDPVNRILYAASWEEGLLALKKESNDNALSHPVDLPAQTGLPDPLVMQDGRKVTDRDTWFKERRPELIRLFQHDMYGQLPPQPESVSGTVERVEVNAFNGKATLTEVTIRFGPPEVPPIHLMLVVPNRRTDLAPVILGMNYFGNHTLVNDTRVRLSDNWMPERGEGVVGNRSTDVSRGTWAQIWRIEETIDRGYAVATFYNGDIDPDTPGERGIQRFFPPADSADACGTIGAWAWGLQRAVDYLISAPGVDPRRIVVTGHSRLGKAALVAAAFDERIAMAIPHQAGCGGSAPSRARIAIGKSWNTLDSPQSKRPETVTDLNEKFPHWFNARFKDFNDQPERLPFDQHCLLALCAPRPVLFTNGRSDTWINPAGQFEMMKSAAPVYRLLDAGDFTATELPLDGILTRGVLGYSLRPGAHSLLREDWQTFLDFADQHFGAPSGREDTGRRDSPAQPIVIDKEHPQTFVYRNGERFFPLGDTAYFLMGRPADAIAHFIDVRRSHGFNFLRMMATGEGYWPFGGTSGNPDYTVIDEAALRKMDWVFDYASARGMNIELILWGYGVDGGEGLWGHEHHEQLWIDTLIKRYRDRDNLFMFTVANEFERYPSGQYRYEPADVEWARRVAERIRRLDRVHLIGCHPSVWITDQDDSNARDRSFGRYQTFIQRRPQVVWPLWNGSEINLNVTQNNEGVQRRSWGNFEDGGRGLTYAQTIWQGVEYPAKWTATGWDFEAAGLEDCIAEDWSHGKPVLNTEFGYQFEPGYEERPNYQTHQVHQSSTVRKKAWKIVTAGGYFAAGFEGTAVSSDWTMRDVDNFRPAALETLYNFFTTKTKYWMLSPHLELVSSHNCLLALPGVEYVAYFPRGGANSIDVVAGSYQVEWLHPESGKYIQQPAVTVLTGRQEFTPPQEALDDWVLHLTKT